MKYIFLLYLTFISAVTSSQDLLVNGSFEEENICTEYRVECAPEGWISTTDGFSNYLKDPNTAFEGKHSMAIKAGRSNKVFDRSYIRSQLLCGLRKGNQYQVDVFVKSRHAIVDSFGIYFTSTDILFHPLPLKNIIASVYAVNSEIQFNPTDTNWQQLRLNYTANGTEAFITMGNFSLRNITGPTGIDKENNFFILVDKVSMVPKNKNEKLCSDWTKVKDEVYDMNERHHYLRRKIKQHDPNKLPPKMSSTILLVMETIVIPDLLFATAQANLSLNGYYFLDSIYYDLEFQNLDSIVIEGHTDIVGEPVFNHQLSHKRAESVKNYILHKPGFGNAIIITRGFGSNKPIADNQTVDGRIKNRRVEIFIYKKK